MTGQASHHTVRPSSAVASGSPLRAGGEPARSAGMERVTVYHNPSCGKSRGALDILRERAVACEVIEYLKTPPDRATYERFLALLIEHYAGAFPLWLAPVQAVILPIADRHLPHASAVQARLEAAGLRVGLDGRVEKIGYKIREAQLQKVPYMLVIGDREAADGTIAVRKQTGGDQGSSTIEAFLAAAVKEIATKGRTTNGAAGQ